MNRKKIISALKAQYAADLKEKSISLNEKITENLKDKAFSKYFTDYKQKQIELYRAKHDSSGVIKAEKNFDLAKETLSKYLQKSNQKLSDFEIKYNCNKCKDTGFVSNKMCDCFNKKLIDKINSSSNSFSLSNTFANSLHKSMKVKNIEKIYDTIKKWCDSFPNTKICNINLLGATGTGKTYLLESIANKMLEKNIVQFVTAFNLNNECRKYHCGEKNNLEDYLTADILLIDDLGTEPMLNNVTKEYFYNIINERIEAKLPTVISSNLLLSDIENRYGLRIFSRLSNKTTALNVMFDGSDSRTNL